MNHNSVAVTRSLYGSRRYAFSFDRSPSELSEEEEGEKKLKTKSIRRNPTCFGNLANSISASSYSPPRRHSFERRALLLREHGRDFGEIRVIAMTQNSRSSARKSLDSVSGITNTITVTMLRENQACAEEGEHGRWQ